MSELLETIKNKLVSAYNPTVIYLFGSYAWGVPDKQSDIDLLIVVKESGGKPYKRAVIGMKSLRGLKIAKDIIVYTTGEFENLSSDVTTLCYKIKNEGIKLYEAAA